MNCKITNTHLLQMLSTVYASSFIVGALFLYTFFICYIFLRVAQQNKNNYNNNNTVDVPYSVITALIWSTV